MNIEFKYPSELPDPEPHLNKYLNLLFKKIGREALESRLQLVLMKWASHSGYHVEFKDNTATFTHVSLMPLGQYLPKHLTT